MKPVRTALSNSVYVSPDDTVADLHCQRFPTERIVASVWQPTEAERAAIAAGANVKLWVYQEPIPPVVLEVVDEPGVGEDAPEIQRRLEQWAAGEVAT